MYATHYAVLNPLRDLVSTNKIKKLSFLRFNNAGVIDLDHLEELLINNENVNFYGNVTQEILFKHLILGQRLNFECKDFF